MYHPISNFKLCQLYRKRTGKADFVIGQVLEWAKSQRDIVIQPDGLILLKREEKYGLLEK